MIKATGVQKAFDDVQAVSDVSVTIKEGNVFGLVGTNGAGKSTFLRMVSGVLKPDAGVVQVDDEDVYENVSTKEKIFYISDEQFFFANATPVDMKNYYKMYYPMFDCARFYKMMGQFELDTKRKINTFSKGMKKQVSIICGICANTKYMLCDETFDGLDPVMRQAVKSIFAGELVNRDFTPVIASHNLRELEDICDHVGLLHKGGVLMSKDLEEMKINIHKIQCVFATQEDENKVKEALDVLQYEQRGSLRVITARGHKDEIMNILQCSDTVFCEVLPLSLEEIFISETEVVGYDIKKLIF